MTVMMMTMITVENGHRRKPWKYRVLGERSSQTDGVRLSGRYAF